VYRRSQENGMAKVLEVFLPTPLASLFTGRNQRKAGKVRWLPDRVDGTIE
jgi:hypothetical protein